MCWHHQIFDRIFLSFHTIDIRYYPDGRYDVIIYGPVPSKKEERAAIRAFYDVLSLQDEKLRGFKAVRFLPGHPPENRPPTRSPAGLCTTQQRLERAEQRRLAQMLQRVLSDPYSGIIITPLITHFPQINHNNV
jgi:hypothetical protein